MRLPQKFFKRSDSRFAESCLQRRKENVSMEQKVGETRAQKKMNENEY